MLKYTIIFISLLIVGCDTKDKERADLSSIFDTNKQEFKINNEKDTTITCQDGTIIKIPKHSFTVSESDSIRFVVKEVYTKSDMIKAGLSTTSNNRILESKGMVYIQSLHDQTELALNKPIEIAFAGNINSEEYKVFYGAFSNKKINWVLDTTTSNYHIFINHILKGSPCGNCDYAYEDFIIDSLKWNRGYTHVDTIVTFTHSNDTLPFSFITWMDVTSTNSRDRVIDKVFSASKLQWINCDRFIDFQEFTTVHIAANKIQNPYVFCVFKDYNSILQSDSQNTMEGVPVGQMVSIIGIDFKEDDIYFGMIPNIKITKDMTIKLRLEKTDKEIVDRVIGRLDK
ncbi:hypothetical protein GXP67_15555 [Rhodocytophaga rosea]|uniref:Uncharacterized protein n=1 Tax=Rhodocytophaga rosea TaxID=2704465 RepID=A0A6C0GJG7_9BACT|nr:hypothetical protein [Rhodocytophaga rosea]QHT67954.1 hypothetical protein GXP67_15555 [Rhodocytophaga rosea]